jgi:hypothetical protein
VLFTVLLLIAHAIGLLLWRLLANMFRLTGWVRFLLLIVRLLLTV